MSFKIGDEVIIIWGKEKAIIIKDDSPIDEYGNKYIGSAGWYTVRYNDGFAGNIHKSELKADIDPSDLLKEIL